MQIDNVPSQNLSECYRYCVANLPRYLTILAMEYIVVGKSLNGRGLAQ